MLFLPPSPRALRDLTVPKLLAPVLQVYALLDVTSTALLELVDLSRHPDEAFGEDLSRDADSAPHERAARDVSDAVTDHTLDETEEELRRFRGRAVPRSRSRGARRRARRPARSAIETKHARRYCVAP